MTQLFNGIPQYGYHLGVEVDGDFVELDLRKTSNFNIAAFGQSGTGKTFTIRKLIQNFWFGNITVIVPDTQGDLAADTYTDIPRDAVKEQFFSYNEGTVFLNCLDISTDGKGGGYYPALQRAIRAIQYFHPSMGIRQKTVLRKVLIETYSRFGISRDDPTTWSRPAPTVDDALATVRAMMFEANTGVGANIQQECSKIRQQAMRLRRKIDTAHAKIASDSRGEDYCEETLDNAKFKVEAAEEELEKKIKLLKEKVSAIVDMQCRGDVDVDDYNFNQSTLSGVEEVLEQMSMSRLFSGSTPFRPVKGVVNVLNMQGVFEKDQQALFFLLLGRVFNDAMNECVELNKGIPETILVCDEAKLYQSVCEDGMSPFPRIVTEGRKFGLGALIGAQLTSQIKKEVLGNISTQILLPLPRSEWKAIQSSYGVTPSLLNELQPKSDGLISIDGDDARPLHLWAWEPRAWASKISKALAS